MKPIVLNVLLLFIVGITIVGCQGITYNDVETDSYTGPQTVDALMKAFDKRYTSRASSAKWATGMETSFGEKRRIEITLKSMDAKYPRQEWIQMLINKGFTIEKFKDYDRLLNLRVDLIMKEFHSEDDFEIAKDTHIDSMLQKHRVKHQVTNEAKRTYPGINDWFVVNGKALPSIPGRMYVQKTENGLSIRQVSTKTRSENGEIISVIGPELSKKQEADLKNKGIEPEGWEVVYLDEEGNIIPSDR
ncbi:hypothetical protein J4G08_17850 [Candidatus Poribacteria bacterium]|nr:hypothetical protein [Candidatus Poribacteria bacterium]